jgi:hypothetical protein
MLAFAALFLPVVLLLVAYDLRWIALTVRAGRLPPWGAFARLFAAVCCHGGIIVLLVHGRDWPPTQLVFWLHMTLDPGLTFYALGLYDLARRVRPRSTPAETPRFPR